MIEYFAFGSNMHLPHLREWLRRFGVEPDAVNDPRRVILPNHRIRTNYLTTSSLGAANIEPSRGEVVEGILLSISPDVQKALRAKEGWPRRYAEIDLEVIMPSTGKPVPAFTYQVTAEHRLPVDVQVSPRYRALILNGAKRAQLSRAYQSHLRAMLKTPLMVAPSPTCWRADDDSPDEADSADRRCA